MDSSQQPEPSPYDTLAQKLFDLIGDQLHAELTSPAFGNALRSAGIAATPACDGVPEPSEEWVESALELFGRFGELTEPLGHAAEMWQAAYKAGWQGYAAQRDDLKAELERSEGLKKELRRQLDAQLREVARLRWAARYLPWPIRCMVMADPPTPGAWRGDRPDEDWATRVDRRATKAGLAPYPGERA